MKGFPAGGNGKQSDAKSENSEFPVRSSTSCVLVGYSMAVALLWRCQSRVATPHTRHVDTRRGDAHAERERQIKEGTTEMAR